MVVFDATILLALLQPDGQPPRDPTTNLPVDRFRERIDFLVATLDKDRRKIIIPTPALSEILVRAGTAGPDYLSQITSSSVFRPVPFDLRAAVEVAAMTREALDSGDKRGGSDEPWAKIKYDWQIVAIAKTEGATIIYSDDRGIYNIGVRNKLTVIKTAQLPLPPECPQGELGFEKRDDDTDDNGDA